MARLLHRIFAHDSRKRNILFLAFAWCLGIANGAGACFYAGDSFSSLMRTAVQSRASIVSLVAVSMLPFLFSAFAVYVRRPRWIFGLCYIRAFLFGLVSMGVINAFGSAGWLIWLLVMFSDIICLILLWWYWLSYMDGHRLFRFGPLLGCTGAVFLIISLESCIISPFLVGLIEI